MWSEIKDVAPVVADVATALAFVAVAIQLWLIRRQNRVEAHLNFVQAEREIWLAAMETNVAPNILKATWSNTPDVNPSEELFLAILMDHYEHQFVRHKRKLLSNEQWEPFEGYIAKQLSAEPAHSIWNQIKKYYSRDFVSHFDALMSNSSIK